jgi:hypothetical protein
VREELQSELPGGSWAAKPSTLINLWHHFFVIGWRRIVQGFVDNKSRSSKRACHQIFFAGPVLLHLLVSVGFKETKAHNMGLGSNSRVTVVRRRWERRVSEEIERGFRTVR